MNRSFTTVLVGVSLMLFADTANSTVLSFRERINDELTSRLVRNVDDGTITFSDSLSGNNEFGVMIDSISYTHSIRDIYPSLLPDGSILQASLKLQITNHANTGLELTVDSLPFTNSRRRNFFIGPDMRDSVSLLATILSEGLLLITLVQFDYASGNNSGGFASFRLHTGVNDEQEGRSNPFILKRSELTVRYLPASVTDITDSYPQLPGNFNLGFNFPNPFNPSTTIDYSLPERSQVRIEIFNLMGQSIRTLIDKEQLTGKHQVVWDGNDQNGQEAASGIYFYRITAGEFSQSRKMLLVK